LFLLISSTDHITGLTGATVTVTLSKNGAAFAAPAGAVTELASGWYKVAGNATDTATLGPLLLHATATGADPTDEEYRIVAYNPDDAVHLGLSAIPNIAAGAAGGLATATNSSGQVTASSVAGNVTGSVGNLAAGAQTDVESALTAQGYTTTRAAKLDDLDAAISTRLSAGGYTAPDNSDITTALGDLVTLLARTDPTTALAAIKAVTDQFAFTTTNRVDATALAVSDKAGYALTSGEHTAISGTDVPAALSAIGLDAAVVQQISALLGSAAVSGNIVTFATPDGAHHWTATYAPTIDAATSITVAQVD
jgi:hypothetical protein